MPFRQENISANLKPEQINPVQLELYKILGLDGDQEKLMNFIEDKSSKIREIIQNNKDIIELIDQKKFKEVAEIVAEKLEGSDDLLIKKQAA
ncbi:MAG: hypothetical protein ABIH48_00875 [Candidatus Falkowbacteria bacterium]